MEKGTIPVTDRVLNMIEDVPVHDGDVAACLRRRRGQTLEELSRELNVWLKMNPHKLSDIERGLRECPAKLLELIS